MNDLVRRLREHDGHLGFLVEEAAAEIERLHGIEAAAQGAAAIYEAEIERLRAALRAAHLALPPFYNADLEETRKILVAAIIHEQYAPSSNSVIPCPNPTECNWPACPLDCKWRPGR